MATQHKYLMCLDGSPSSTGAFKSLVGTLRPSDSLVVLNCWWAGDKIRPLGEVAKALDMVQTSQVLAEAKANGGKHKSDEESGVHHVIKEHARASSLLLRLAKEYVKQHEVKLACFETLSEEVADPREIIVSLAARKGADTIVVGTRGLGSIKSILMGSVSQYVLAHAPCSVLLHRDPAKQCKDINSL